MKVWELVQSKDIKDMNRVEIRFILDYKHMLLLGYIKELNEREIELTK